MKVHKTTIYSAKWQENALYLVLKSNTGLLRYTPFHTACRGESFAQEREFRFDSTGGPNLVTPQSAIDTWTDEVRALL